MKFLTDTVHSPPLWQAVHLACLNSSRPSAIAADDTPPWISWSVSGPLGTRIANWIQAFNASIAGQAVVLPGRVTVTCVRPVLGLRKSFTTHGG